MNLPEKTQNKSAMGRFLTNGALLIKTTKQKQSNKQKLDPVIFNSYKFGIYIFPPRNYHLQEWASYTLKNHHQLSTNSKGTAPPTEALPYQKRITIFTLQLTEPHQYLRLNRYSCF